MIDTQRTVVFRLTIEEISGFLAKLLYVLLRTSCSPGWDAAAPVRRLDARLSGFWPRACALGPADWSGWQPAQVKERHGCPRHRRSHFGRCARIIPKIPTRLGGDFSAAQTAAEVRLANYRIDPTFVTREIMLTWPLTTMYNNWYNTAINSPNKRI